MQIHKFGPIQSLNLPNRQIQPIQPMTWTAGSNLYIGSIAGHIFCNLTQSGWVQVKPKPKPTQPMDSPNCNYSSPL